MQQCYGKQTMEVWKIAKMQVVKRKQAILQIIRKLAKKWKRITIRKDSKVEKWQ